MNLKKLSQRIYPKEAVARPIIKEEVQEEMQNGSGCVATMGSIEKPKDSQRDMSMDDILNSSMVNKAVELFQPETQIRVKNKI